MNFVIFENEEEGRFVLTDEREDGFWMLRISGAPNVKDGDYAPSDILDASFDPPMYAAGAVYNWAVEVERADDEIAAARDYLRRWPDGPQAEEEDIEQAQAFKSALPQVFRELDTDEPCYTEMKPDQLMAAIHRMTGELADYDTHSPHAFVLRMRIVSAATMLYGYAVRDSRSGNSRNQGKITAEWLQDAGFKRLQDEQSKSERWMLWLREEKDGPTEPEGLGIELAKGNEIGKDDADWWHCWVRDGHRFVHVRHIVTRRDVIKMAEGLAGSDWRPARHEKSEKDGSQE